ncbi:LOW QUALITY PROTEIN: uncharacterized protein ACR2FA_003042 [Aphomia sociella]
MVCMHQLLTAAAVLRVVVVQNKCTGDNEEYVSCPDCSPQTCDSIGKIYHCPLENTENCNGTCRCKNGYYRNIIGECISKAECSMCNGTHEYFTCGGACDNVCGILHKQNQTNCPIINKRCNRKCYCEEGYARDSNDKCVAIKDCKVNKCNCTKPNEVYDTCPVPCPFRTCGIDDRLVFCAPPEECPPPACRCQDGFFRDDKGNCVKWNDCPKCKMPNEEYDPCPAPCPPRRCDVDDRLIRCKAPPKLGNPECKPGCRCSDGFAKNDKGYQMEVLSEARWIYWLCQYEILTSVSAGIIANPTSIPYVGIDEFARRMNIKEAYVLDKVSEDDCDYAEVSFACRLRGKYDLYSGGSRKKCRKQEIYETCVKPCRIQNCSEVGFPRSCPENSNDGPACLPEPACVCDDNYYRNKHGVCVPSNKCPSCGGDPNARPGCGNCRKTCANYKQEDPIFCTAICYDNACDCLPDYVLDGNTGKCVLPENCTPVCGKDEVYSSCVNGGCDKKNCSQLSQPTLCIDPIKCWGGCICRKGYLRATNGTCVPIAKCDLEETCVTVAPDTNSCKDADDQLNNFEKGNIGFTGKFFYEVAKSKPGESVIMSAFSVLLLAQLALYTSGSSLDELLKIFNLQNKEQIRCVFPKLIAILQTQQNNTLDLGAKVFVNQEYPLTDNFKKDSLEIFDAEAENIDVNNPNQAAATINDWAADKTRNRITGLISPDAITSLTRLILANAIYFKGTWKTQFDPKNTKDQDYYVTKDDVIQVKTMKVKDKFNYAESTELNAKIIELPYVGEVIKFIGILPNDVEGLTDLLEKLQDENVFNIAINSLNQETVTVLLPTMDISTTIDLTEILPKADITKIFDASTSKLSGIIQSNEPLYVSDGTQKATILVNEEGSEAAAANVIGVTTTSAVLNPPQEYFFNVNHPVAYYILFNNIPLFCGTFVKP